MYINTITGAPCIVVNVIVPDSRAFSFYKIYN